MKLVLNGRQVKVSTIEIENVDMCDYPDFCDAFIGYAEFEDGEELTEDEKLELESKNRAVMNMLAHESLF